ncbi:MAG: hypothetical protein ABSE52_04600 [Candidatus Dormibacteria bacterium]
MSTGATAVLAYSGNGVTANCQPAAGLSLAIGKPPQPGPAGSVAADGSLTLYCRTTGTNSRDGIYTPGTNPPPPKAGTPCSVNIGYEGAQVLGQSFLESEYLPGAVTVFPFALWTGTINADIVPSSGSFGDLWGSVADTAPAALGVNWAAASQYGPAPPSALPDSGLATGGFIMSGLENQTLVASVTTEPGGDGEWEKSSGGEWLCDGPRLSLTVQPEPDVATPPSETPPVETTWAVPTVQQAMAVAGVTAGQVQTSAPDNYVVFAPTTFWITPQPQGPDVPPVVTNVIGPPDANGESIVYSYYLAVEPSDTINWTFGDGTTGTSQAESSGPGEAGITHYYKQISGEGALPAAGSTVSAAQDVTVTAFVGWIDGTNTAYYECVTPDGGVDGINHNTQAQAITACSITYPDALVDAALPAKPVYQVRTVPVA